MTRLDRIARVVFHEHDDKLLGYLKEEGQSIEPQWCLLSLLDYHHMLLFLVSQLLDCLKEEGQSIELQW